LSNLFAGVSIAADAPYKKGDYIVLETGERGMVTHIGLRSTCILTRDDVEITIPNGVTYGSDVNEVIASPESVAEAHSEVCEMPAPLVRFRTFGESCLDCELLCWIEQPVDRGRMIHELNCAV